MSKIIAVSDEAYNRLKRIKDNDSFSKVILRLTDKPNTKSLLDVINSWAPDEELAKNVEEAYKNRKNFKFKRVTF